MCQNLVSFMKKDWLKFTWKSTHTNFFLHFFSFNFSFSALIDLFMVFKTPSSTKEGGGDLSLTHDLSDPFRIPAIQAILS